MIIGSILIILLGIVFLYIKPDDIGSGNGYILIVIAILLFIGGLSGFTVKILSGDKIKRITKGETSITPAQFLKLRKTADLPAFKGVYILHNKTRKKYYVGQASNVMARLNQHFSGKGNGDVYADWKYGNRFKIRIVPLKGSRFKSLDELERFTIKKYHAYSAGYNKTRGNNN